MSGSGRTREVPLWTEGGSPTRARAWQVAFWATIVPGFLLVFSVPENGDGPAWPVVLGLTLFGVSMMCLVRWRKQARVPRVVYPVALQVPSRRGFPGSSRRRGKLVLDQRALIFRIAEPSLVHWAARYRNIAEARLLAVGQEGKEKEFVEVTLHDGTRTAFTAPDVDAVLRILRAHDVRIVDPESVEQVDPHDTRRRLARRLAWAAAGLVLVFVIVVAIGALINHPADSDDDGPSRAELAAAKAEVGKHLDGWDLPDTVVESEIPDRVHSDDPLISVVRSYVPAPGVSEPEATKDLMTMLRTHGYHFDSHDDTFGGYGECRLPGHPDCLLSIDWDPDLAQVIEVELLL